jgi:hypothetical protein
MRSRRRRVGKPRWPTDLNTLRVPAGRVSLADHGGYCGREMHAAHLLRSVEGAPTRASRRSRETREVQPGRRQRSALGSEDQAADELALERGSTDAAPWRIVPSDHNRYERAVAPRREALEAMNRAKPKADFDDGEPKQRLAAT